MFGLLRRQGRPLLADARHFRETRRLGFHRSFELPAAGGLGPLGLEVLWAACESTATRSRWEFGQGIGRCVGPDFERPRTAGAISNKEQGSQQSKAAAPFRLRSAGVTHPSSPQHFAVDSLPSQLFLVVWSLCKKYLISFCIKPFFWNPFLNTHFTPQVSTTDRSH